MGQWVMGHGSDGSHKLMGQMGHGFVTYDPWVNGSRYVMMGQSVMLGSDVLRY